MIDISGGTRSIIKLDGLAMWARSDNNIFTGDTVIDSRIGVRIVNENCEGNVIDKLMLINVDTPIDDNGTGTVIGNIYDR